MSESIHRDGASDFRWPTSDQRVLGQSVSDAEDTLRAKSDELHDIRDEWLERARTSVRGNPLISVAAALALGAAIARIAR